MDKKSLYLLLADDDEDDCFLFQEALKELNMPVRMGVAQDGEKLMQLLSKESGSFPNIIFLDLNMPRKSGIECLAAIKRNNKLKKIPVVIFSTSLQQKVVNRLYNDGAQFYIRKPAEFLQLKNVIQKAVQMVTKSFAQPSRENFVLFK